jgi:hypothetical protein
MKQRLFKGALVLGAAAALMACARINDIGILVFSSTVQAAAILNGQLLQGQVQLSPDRTGSVTLLAEQTAEKAATPTLSQCMGRLRYSSTAAGTMDLRCNDGTSVELVFSLIGETRGYAYGQNSTGPVSLVFGLTPSESMAYLKPPPNKQLSERVGTPLLELH